MLHYCAACSALLVTNFWGQHWKDRLKDLKDSDVCGPGKDGFYLQEPGKAASKGHYEISWIWLVPKSKSEVDTTVQRKFLMKGYELNGQSHKQGKCDGRKRFRSFRRRCDKPSFTMSGRNSGGSNKILSQRLVKIPFNMEFLHIHKNKHIIVNVWLRVLL